MVSTVSHGNVLDNFDKRVNPMKTSPDSVGQSRDVPNAGSGSTTAGLEEVSSGCERSSTRNRAIPCGSLPELFDGGLR
jgi:hypothetical protein